MIRWHELIKRLHSRFSLEGIEINYPVRKLVGQKSQTDRAYDGDEPEGDPESVKPAIGRRPL